MRDGDEKEGVGWTDGFLLREVVPENALSERVPVSQA